MSYILENGFRKNRYFEEEKHFREDLFKPLGIEGKEVEFSFRNNESKIDLFLSKEKAVLFNHKGYEEVEIEGKGNIVYEIEGEEEISLNYKGDTAVREIFIIKENSRATIKTFIEGSFVYLNREFYVNENSSLDIKTGILNHGFTEVISNIYLEGERSKAWERTGLTSQKGESRIYTQLNHVGKNTEGDSYAKAVLRKEAKCSIEGMIKIYKKGVKTNSYLNQHILLFENANAYAFPALEIENNDVKASHSASVSEINEEDLFYLMNRGLDKKEAERMIIEGFLRDVILEKKLADFINV